MGMCTETSSNTLDRYNSIGIILAGGGAKGAYQAGALKAIYDFLSKHDAHHKVRMIAGTSIGSWNALFWLAGLMESGELRQCGLEEWWSNISLLSLVRWAYIPLLRNYLLSPSPWTRTFERVFAADQAAERLRRHIEKPNDPRSIHFYFTRSNIAGAQLEVTTNRDLKNTPANLPAEGWKAGVRRIESCKAESIDDLRTAVFSSMDLPPLFKYSKIGDYFYEDGGVIDNLPIQFGTEAEHCDLLFILPLNATFAEEVSHRSIIKRLYRVMNVRQGVLERNSFKMIYLYNELAALRQNTEHLQALIERAYDVLAKQPDSSIQALIEELQRARVGIAVESHEATKETPLSERALIRRHRPVQVFAICPAPKLAVNTVDFWKREKAGEAFRLMHKTTTAQLNKFFIDPPEYVRVALVPPHGEVTYLEEF